MRRAIFENLTFARFTEGKKVRRKLLVVFELLNGRRRMRGSELVADT